MSRFIIIIPLLVFTFACNIPTKHIDNIDVADISTNKISCSVIERRVVVDVCFNDSVRARMILDNGCSEIILAESFFMANKEKLGLSPFRDLHAMGEFIFNPNLKSFIAEGQITLNVLDTAILCTNLSMYYVDTLKIDHFVEVTDSITFASLSVDVDGILPLRLLSALGIVNINLQKQEISFKDSIDNDYIAYPFQSAKNNSINYPIGIYVNDSVVKQNTYKAVFDLGYGGSMIIFNRKMNAVLKLQTPENKYISRRDNSNYFKSRPLNYSIKTSQLGVEKTIYEDLDICNLGVNFNYDFDCLVGVSMIKEFEIAFDYRENIFYIRPLTKILHKQDTASWLYGVRCMLETTPQKGYYVSYVEDSLLTRLRVNDMFYKIDNKEVGVLSMEEFTEYKRKSKKDIKSLTVLRNGKEITINLEE
ncbi:hypothetical protein FACS1894178_1090 [Bacteroidia bacterium]|nr:hypothetical protein FACS1894178_1090 [Bacteroidia bacterium]